MDAANYLLQYIKSHFQHRHAKAFCPFWTLFGIMEEFLFSSSVLFIIYLDTWTYNKHSKT